MPKRKPASSETAKKIRPALSQEARDNQLIALAYNLVEQRLLDGTASSQETVHFLKLGSPKEKLERKILEKQEELIEAKTQNLKSAKRIDELFEQAMVAMTSYRGSDKVDGDENIL